MKIEYECDFGELAKQILSNIKPTPYNKEIIQSWEEVAVENNINDLYNTLDTIEL